MQFDHKTKLVEETTGLNKFLPQANRVQANTYNYFVEFSAQNDVKEGETIQLAVIKGKSRVHALNFEVKTDEKNVKFEYGLTSRPAPIKSAKNIHQLITPLSDSNASVYATLVGGELKKGDSIVGAVTYTLGY